MTSISLADTSSKLDFGGSLKKTKETGELGAAFSDVFQSIDTPAKPKSAEENMLNPQEQTSETVTEGMVNVMPLDGIIQKIMTFPMSMDAIETLPTKLPTEAIDVLSDTPIAPSIVAEIPASAVLMAPLTAKTDDGLDIGMVTESEIDEMQSQISDLIELSTQDSDVVDPEITEQTLSVSPTPETHVQAAAALGAQVSNGMATPASQASQAKQNARTLMTPITNTATSIMTESVETNSATLAPPSQPTTPKINPELAGLQYGLSDQFADTMAQITKPPMSEPEMAAPQPQTQFAAVAPTAQPQTPQMQAPAQIETVQNTPVIPTTDPVWMDKMVEHIKQSFAEGIPTLDIALTPETLGHVNIRLEVKGDIANVQVVTETLDAQKLFNDNQNRLSEMFSKAGLELGQHTAHNSSHHQQNGSNHAQAGNALGDDAGQTETSDTQPKASNSLVDLVA